MFTAAWRNGYASDDCMKAVVVSVEGSENY